MASRHILITGATGFIGSYVARLLSADENNQVVATCRRSSDFSLVQDIRDRIHWVESDLLGIRELPPAATPVHAVIHCAGLVDFHPLHWNRLVASNVKGTAAVVDWCLDHDVKRLIYVSSTTALGRGKDGQLIDEGAQWEQHPLSSLYARSKYLAELEVFRGIAEGLQATIINPPFVLGGGWWDKGPLAMLGLLMRGLSYYPVGSNGVVDVRDLAGLIAQLTKHPDPDQRYICSAVNLSHHQLAQKMAHHLEVAPPARPIGPVLSRMVAIASPVAALFGSSTFSAQALRLANRSFLYDNRRSIDVPGFQYRDPDWTIGDTCNLFRTSTEEGRNYGILPM